MEDANASDAPSMACVTASYRTSENLRESSKSTTTVPVNFLSAAWAIDSFTTEYSHSRIALLSSR